MGRIDPSSSKPAIHPEPLRHIRHSKGDKAMKIAERFFSERHIGLLGGSRRSFDAQHHLKTSATERVKGIGQGLTTLHSLGSPLHGRVSRR